MNIHNCINTDTKQEDTPNTKSFLSPATAGRRR